MNFKGSVILKKQMHTCSWKIAKDPGKPTECFLDYVPTIYWCKITDDETGSTYNFTGVGKFTDQSTKLFNNYDELMNAD